MRRLRLYIVVVTTIAAALPAASQTLIGTVPIGAGATYVAVNSNSNKIYTTNFNDNTVTAIDGVTDGATTIAVGQHPEFLVINPITNKIYVNNRKDSTVSVINGANNQVIKTISGFDHNVGSDLNPLTNKIYVANSGNGADNTVGIIDGSSDTLINTITVDNVPWVVAVNPVTNKIYVANQCGVSNDCTDHGTVTVIDGATNHTTSVAVGWLPGVILINTLTNKIYVLNICGNNAQSADCLANGTIVQGSVTVIDGATNATSSVNTGVGSGALAVNPVTNEAYVANSSDNTVTFINGNNLSTTTVNVGSTPADVEVNPVTDKIYVTDNGTNTVTMIDGQNHHTTTITVGNNPGSAAVNQVTNRYYNINGSDNTVSVVQGAGTNAVQFVAVAPCRLVDTRFSGGGPVRGGTSQSFTVPQLGDCGIPSNASAYSLNVTVVPPGPLGYLTIWPTGVLQPVVSTMNSLDGRTKANAAIVPAGYQGAVSVFASNTTDVILDINGYFVPPSGETYQFYTLDPCRVIDTRNPNDPLAGPYLTGGVTRNFPVENSPCIPTGVDVKAYSFNVTVVPHQTGQALGYLTVWPQGENQPVVSTLNNPTGTDVANAAVVPAPTGGGISVFPSNDTDLVVDINGYFAAAGAPNALSLYSEAPCRVIDTRNVGNGHPFTGEKTVNVVGSACAPPSAAKAYVFNATVVPSGQLGYLTLWPDGQQQPGVSTLNALDSAITSNMAIVPTTDGSIDAFASNPTQLILDISSYFAP